MQPGCSAGHAESLEATLCRWSVHRGVFAVQCFPGDHGPTSSSACGPGTATAKNTNWASCAAWTIGRRRAKSLIREALSRRYLLRRIEAIDDITLEHGYLNFRVRTDQGPCGVHHALDAKPSPRLRRAGARCWSTWRTTGFWCPTSTPCRAASGNFSSDLSIGSRPTSIRQCGQQGTTSTRETPTTRGPQLGACIVTFLATMRQTCTGTCFSTRYGTRTV